jgi:tRNA-dihydrouridine synthase B
MIFLSFSIKDLIIENQLVLAPMAGVSNNAFRVIARSMGAGLVFAEMVSDKGLIYNNEKTIRLLHMTEDERPVAQQIFGSNLETMVEAARFVEMNTNADIIDINMGCPVPKVAVRAQAGASLMKDPNRIYEIVKAVSQATKRPVTIKIRSGWDDQSINAVEVSRQAEAAGAAMITVHGRTRAQGYTGKADWDIIRSVKEAVMIPVIGNGDVVDGESAKQMLEKTGCDAIMIGRAALGNPWIFREINQYLKDGTQIDRPSDLEIRDMMVRHLDSLIAMKGEHIALLEMRSHGPWYLKGMDHASSLRKVLSRTSRRDDFVIAVDTFFKIKV